MNPTPRQVHVNMALTNMSVAYMQSAEAFIASQVFPLFPVDKQTDKFFVYEKSDYFRDDAEERAPGTESAGGGHKLSTDIYSCKNYAWHEDIDDQTRENSDSQINLDQDATEIVTHKMLLRREKSWATNNFKTGVWNNEVAGVAGAPNAGQFRRWDDYVNSDPRKDIKTGMRKILSTTGYKPNCLVLSYDTKDALIDHPTFVERVKYTSRESVTAEQIAAYFDIERVLVTMAVENTGREGRPDELDFVYGKHSLLCYVARRPGRKVPSAGYTFTWRYAPIAPREGVRVRRFRMEHLESDRIEGSIAFDDKRVGADLGYFFKDCVG